MKIGELTSSKFLKGTDFPKPTVCTIGRVTKENVAKPSDPKKERGVMYFEEFEKGLVLNATNLKRAAAACGSDDTDDWTGKKVTVYYDENVEFGGDLVGGIRLRKAQQAGTKARTFEEELEDDSDVSFPPK